MLLSEYDWQQKEQNMDEELFSEPEDKIKKMINDAVKESLNDQFGESKNDYNDTQSSFDNITSLVDGFVNAFKKDGYSRKEAVYLAGQVLGGYTTGVSLISTMEASL